MVTEQDTEGGIQTPGRTKLLAWIAESPERTQSAIARMIGVSQPAFRNWLLGLARPEPHFRAVLRELCGIPEEDWELGEERAKREEALRRIREEADGAVLPTGTDE